MLEKLGGGLDAAQKREAIVRSGILAELALIEAQADRAALSRVLFRRAEFPKLQAADPSAQILTMLVRSIEKRLPALSPSEPIERAAPPSDEAEETGFGQSDPVTSAVKRAAAHSKRAVADYRRKFARSERGLDRPLKGGSVDLPGIQRQIGWIGDRLKLGETARAEKAVVKLIERQCKRGRPEDIVKTLTAVANLARSARLFNWTWRLLAALDHLGVPDPAALNVRAETLRDLGRYDEALAAFEKTMDRFPHDEVAPNAYAETLRDVGRYEEALAAFEETMDRFPHDEVAPNAYAETLRDLGRYDEALAAFEKTMDRFPHNEVAPNAYGHLLAELGRIKEAEARLAPAAERLRTVGDWIAAHILAMARLRDGRTKEALVELERGAQSCPFREQRRYFETALPLALLADQRAAEAASQLEAIAKDPTLSHVVAATIVLFLAHALAEAGERQRAQGLVESAQVIDFAAAKQKRLASALTERYGLAGGPPASGAGAQQLSEDIATLEFELVRPKLWSFRAKIRRAA